MKIISYLLLLIVLISCNKKKNTSEDEYILSGKYLSEYKNEYSNKGKLIKVLQITTSESFAEGVRGKAQDISEQMYFYDERDSLIHKKDFSIYEDGRRELNSDEFHTDSTFEQIGYGSSPLDTTLYTYTIKDKNGNYIEMYRESRIMEPDRKKISYRYENNRMILRTVVDLIGKTSKTCNYTYNTVGDTLYTTIAEEKGFITKEYKTQEYAITIEEDPIMGYSDSLFYKGNNVIRHISIREDGEKREQLCEYDQHGNITRWEDISYKTKEKLQKDKEEVGCSENYNPSL